MFRKALILTALVTGLALSSAPREASASSCPSQCYQSWGECCGFASFCEPYYQDCLTSCGYGGEPWLIC